MDTPNSTLKTSERTEINIIQEEIPPWYIYETLDQKRI